MRVIRRWGLHIVVLGMLVVWLTGCGPAQFTSPRSAGREAGPTRVAVPAATSAAADAYPPPPQPSPAVQRGSPAGWEFPMPPRPSPPSTVVISTVLANTRWRLESLGPRGAEISVSEQLISLAFDQAGRAGGQAACNSYHGSYTIVGQTLHLGQMSHTLRNCGVDKLMWEARYLVALQSVETFALTGDRLIIEYDSGRAVLSFARVGRP